ncbi:MAG TPA: hypothetical protein VMB46_10275 [Methanomassiliicoccales archaeon]|nr:hypothetical protein [Methanomassiliicoccales archaeon]
MSKEKIRIASGAAFVVLLAAAAVIIIEYPNALSELFSQPEQPPMQIISRDYAAGRNESGKDNVNVTFIITIKNFGTLNESKTLVCSISFETNSGIMTYENKTLVSLAPGDTRTYRPVIDLPNDAKSVSWTLNTELE